MKPRPDLDQSGKMSMKGPEIQQIKRTPKIDKALKLQFEDESKQAEYENDLKLAIEDAIDQLHYIESGKENPRLPVNHLRYTTRKSIINLRTQLERLFPDSELIEKYKEVTLD